MADIIISGYHGFANSGDEALLFAMLNTLRRKKPDIDVTVLSKTPADTAREYNVKSIYRYNIIKIIREMRMSKLLVFGGGSLLQDVTSRKSILYYLAIIFMARISKMKIMLYANGIGPITRRLNKMLTKFVLNKVNLITLRDDKSDIELKKLGINKPKIIITADPAFAIETKGAFSGKYFTKMAGASKDTKLCVVSVRKWMKSKQNFVSEMAELCDYMVNEHNIYPLFVPMQYPTDISISEDIMRKMKNTAYILNRELTVPEMFCVLSEAELVIGMRLHSLIYATTLEIPAMAIVYDPKISAFMESVNQKDNINVESFEFKKAKEVLNSIVTKKTEYKEKLHETNKKLKDLAKENANYAINLLED